MKRPSNYQTKQGEAILEFLRQNSENHVTAADVSAALDISLPTVYRRLSSLSESGLVRKYVLEKESSACYQYADDCPHDHFHLKCEGCETLVHMDKAAFPDSMFQGYDFKVNINKTVFYGMCKKCSEKS
jgi:Fe2+/Zn2+ uptake regulation proteins